MAHCWAIVKILFVTKAGRHRIAALVAAELAGFAPAGIHYSVEPVVAAAAAAAVLVVLAGLLAAVVEAECHSPGRTGENA